jgi:transaldolase
VKIFLDTADINQIREAAAIGLVDGVTTNPTLISRVEGKFEDIIREICETVDGPVSAEVVSLDAAGMVEEAKKLAAIHKNVVIKIPMTKDGARAIRELKTLGIRTNCTLVFSANQAFIAAKAPAGLRMSRPSLSSASVAWPQPAISTQSDLATPSLARPSSVATIRPA